jgi:hypothetical protein
MAGGKLTVEIGADITDFENKIKEVELDIKELSKVKLDRLKIGLDTTEINSQIKDAKASLNSLKTTVKDTGAQIGGQFTRQVGNGANTLTQFSRIAQDAPFGIIGIGNNITATAESFSYLKAQTGSTGGALKALASSIAGTGGILLGVSLLTTGLTLLAQSGLSVGDVIDKITGNFDKFGRELQKVTAEASKQSGTEISNLKALVSVAQDDTISREKRLIAVKELQKEFPAYFGNLNTEKILNGDLTGVTNELTKAIIERAKATAFSNKIGELSLEREQLKSNLANEILSIAKAYNLSSEETKKFYEEVKQGADVFKLIEPFKKRVGIFDLAGAVASSNAIKDIRKELIINQNEQDKYTQRIEDSTEAAIKLKQEIAKPTKTFSTPQVTGIGNNIIPAPLFKVKDIAVFNGQVDGFGNKIKELPGIIKAEMLKATTAADTGMILFNERWAQFGLDFSAILETGIETSLIDFGTAIGNSLVNGLSVLETIGASLLSSIGNTIKAVGTELVKMGILAQAYAAVVKYMKKAFANPYALAAAGVALVIVGAAISASASKVGSGGGGGASGASGAGANNQSFTSSGFSGGGGGGGTVVFEIAGQKLIGVLNNTLNSNRRLGGTLGLG